ncbi:MAG: AAA family ATPase [Armatimonadota bacterium]|nr:AAA family ATPase [Armatimonadota bacterium]
MKLKSLQLVNYRCFEDSGEIPLSQFTVFIGRNDGGKSSALLALYKLLGGQPFEDDDHRKRASMEDGEEPQIAEEMEVRIRTVDDDSQYHYRCIRRVSPPESLPQLAYELEQDCVEEAELNLDFETLGLEYLKAICQKHKIDLDGPRSSKATFVAALLQYRSTLPTYRGWVSASKNFRGRLPLVSQYAEGSETDPQQTIRKSMNDFYRNSVLPDHRKSLDAARRDVEERLNDEASKYVPVLAEHCQSVEGISIDLADSSFENIEIHKVSITQGGGAPIDWARIGRGKRREMSLAVFRFHAKLLKDALEQPVQDGEDESKNVAALFDEPDLNLDYDAQRRMSAILQELGSHPQCQVLIATHSVNLIDNTPLSQICFFDTAGVAPHEATIECFAPDEDEEILEILRTSMGLRNSAFFNEKIFVVCEGPTEMAALPVIFGRVTGFSMSLCGIHLINGLDNEEAKRIAKVLKKNRRAVHLILDQDCRANSKFSDGGLSRSYLDPKSEVTFVGETEFEDAFDDVVWLALLNQYYPRCDGEPWTAADISKAHESAKFSTCMAEAIGLHSGHVSKPQLGCQLANVASLIGHIPLALEGLVTALYQRAKGV